MSGVALQSGCGRSAFINAERSPYAPADDAARFSAFTQDLQSRGWDRLIDELLRIRLLQDDWDGEGSLAPDPSVVDGAIKLALHFKSGNYLPANRVIASDNGTIYFEWMSPLDYQEIEVTSLVDAELRRVEKGSKSTDAVGILIP